MMKWRDLEEHPLLAIVGFCKNQHLFGKRHKRNDSCVAWSSFGTPNSRNRAYALCFDWLLGPYSS